MFALTPSRHANVPCECLLIGVCRKWLADSRNDEIDAERTSGQSDRLDGDEHAGDFGAEPDHCPRWLRPGEKLRVRLVISL
jgi:hypothetical protein